jgi:hypothetical protein
VQEKKEPWLAVVIVAIAYWYVSVTLLSYRTPTQFVITQQSWGKPNNFTLANSLLLLLQESSTQCKSELAT